MKLFSVTEVLSPWANEEFQKKNIPQKNVRHASVRGSLTHDWCLNGYALSLPKPALPDLYKGYGESFVKWFDKYVVRVIWVEKELRDNEFGIVGHPDILCIVDFQNKQGNILALPDLKTPVEYSAYWQVQLSTYLHLVKKWLEFGDTPWKEVPKVDWVGSLQLDPKGGFPKPHKHTYAERDFAIFLQALNVRRYLG